MSRLAAIFTPLILLSCSGAPSSEAGNTSSPASAPVADGGIPEAPAAGEAAAAQAPGRDAQPNFEGKPAAPGVLAEAAKPSGFASDLPDGLYMLTWSTEQRDGMSVKMTAKTGDGSSQIQGARYETEISTRNGEISGCVLSKEGGKAEPIMARCEMSGGELVITLIDESGNGNAMEMRMAPDAKGDYAGKIALVSALLPGGRVEIGNSMMRKVS